MNTVIGIDVSKATLDVMWLRDPETLKVKSKKLTNTPDGRQALLDWAVKTTGHPLEAIRFVMEATGVYHERLACALYEAGAEVVVANPAHVRSYAQSFGVRTKNDCKDAMILARFGATQGPHRRWQPEAPEVYRLKTLLNRLDTVQEDLQREQNRLEKAKASREAPLVQASLERVIEHLEQEATELNRQIDDDIQQNPKFKQDRKLLESIPGIAEVLSRYLLVLFHSRQFLKASQMAAYLGLNLVGETSGTSVNKPPRLSKVGPARWRAKLYMPAIVATQYNPDAKALYERLVNAGKAKKAALGAVMRKLVHIAFGVLTHQQAFVAQSAA